MNFLSKRWWRRFSRDLRRSLSRSLGRTLFGLFSALRWTFWILTWPIWGLYRHFVRGWQHAKLRNLLFGLPALTALIAVGILWQAARAHSFTVRSEYLNEARDAIRDEEYASAEIYLQRVISQARSPQAEFDLAEVYENTDREPRAQAIYQRLAPNDKRGYPPAHRKRAMHLSERLSTNSSGDEVRLVRWHLTLADAQRTPSMARAWATYYLAINQADRAIEYLENAVRGYPELSLLLANLYMTRGKSEAAQKSYTNASEFLRQRIEVDPQNQSARVMFANTLLKLGRHEECMNVLELGMNLDPEGPYKQLLASLFTNRHDALAQQEGAAISALLGQLRIALSYDPNFGPAYERLLKYGTANVEGEADLGEILADVIAQGEEPGLAHFAMSIHKWKVEEIPSAKWHLERAYSLLPEMPFVANNLAWILATEEPRDLQQALEIIDPVVNEYSFEPRLLDTRATILMQMERWDEALDDLEKALRNQQNPTARRELHEKMATVCDELNQPQLAERHRARMQELPLAPENDSKR